MGKRTKKADQKPEAADFKDLESIENISDHNGEANDAPADKVEEPELTAPVEMGISDEQVKQEAELSASKQKDFVEKAAPKQKNLSAKKSFIEMLQERQAARNASFKERYKARIKKGKK